MHIFTFCNDNNGPHTLIDFSGFDATRERDCDTDNVVVRFRHASHQTTQTDASVKETDATALVLSRDDAARLARKLQLAVRAPVLDRTRQCRGVGTSQLVSDNFDPYPKVSCPECHQIMGVAHFYRSTGEGTVPFHYAVKEGT